MRTMLLDKHLEKLIVAGLSYNRKLANTTTSSCNNRCHMSTKRVTIRNSQIVLLFDILVFHLYDLYLKVNHLELLKNNLVPDQT